VPPALRYRDFRLFVFGAFVSVAGTQFTTVAMAWQMYQLTNSALQVGLLGLARAVPQITLSLFSGILADTIDRRRLLMIVQLAQCAVSTSLCVLTLSGAMTAGKLLAAAVLFAVATSVETPGRQAIVPNLVPKEALRSAIATNNTQRYASMIAGPSLAGVALAAAGPGLCYSIDAASWFVMLTALFFIRRPLQDAATFKPSLEVFLAGARFVRRQQVILSFMALDFGATFFGSSNALLPIYARDILQAGPVGLGVLYAATAAGAVIAGFVLSTALHVDRAGKWILLGVTLYGVCIIGFALSHVLWISVLLLAGSGFGNTVSAVLRGTSNQLLTPDQLRGRVAAVNSMFTLGGPQLGQFESGLVANFAGAQVSAFTGGLGACLLVAAIAMVPKVREFTFSGHAQPELAPMPALATSTRRA
jgi:MFS family permease